MRPLNAAAPAQDHQPEEAVREAPASEASVVLPFRRARASHSRTAAEPRVSVLIPALNEERNIGWVLDEMEGRWDEIILIVGSSEDRTIEVAQRHRPDIKVIVQTRAGKGNALLCGFAAATGDIIVTIDADGSTDPREIPLYVEALLAGADYAKGSRYLDGGGSTDLSTLRSLGNRVLLALANWMYRTKYTDLCYGFNAMWADTVGVLRLDPGDGPGRRRGDGFEVETVMNTRAALAGVTIAEVPSFEGARRFGASHLSVVADGWRVLTTIRAERRSWRRHMQSAPSVARDAEALSIAESEPLFVVA